MRLIAFLMSFFISTNVFAANLSKTYRQDINYSIDNLSNQKIKLMGFTALLGSSFLLDRGTRSYFKRHRNSKMRRFSNWMNEFGNGYYLMPAASALGTIGYAEKDEKLLDASFTSVESGLTAGIVTVGIKALVGRERPYATNNPFKFKPFSITSRTKYHSFPSGHTTMAWAMITPYAVYYNQPLLYLIPLSVNFARIYKNRHWLSDTVMGTGIGFSIGYLFSESHKQNRFTLISDGRSLCLGVRF